MLDLAQSIKYPSPQRILNLFKSVFKTVPKFFIGASTCAPGLRTHHEWLVKIAIVNIATL